MVWARESRIRVAKSEAPLRAFTNPLRAAATMSPTERPATSSSPATTSSTAMMWAPMRWKRVLEAQ